MAPQRHEATTRRLGGGWLSLDGRPTCPAREEITEEITMEDAFWQSVVEADYAVPEGERADVLLPELVTMLGSPDPVARDEHAYPILATWIERGVYTSAELRALGTAMEANLKVGIAEPEQDTVFLRTFSALILASVIEYDHHHPFLEERELRIWLDAGLRYLEQELDVRGYIQGKGWAHSVAHTADLLMMLSQSRYLGRPDLERILNAIADKVRRRVAHTYLYDEDERLAYAVRKALKRDLLEMPFLTTWLKRLTALDGISSWAEAAKNTSDICAYINIRDFARSLYFQLKLGQEPPASAAALCAEIEETLRGLDPGFYHLA